MQNANFSSNVNDSFPKLHGNRGEEILNIIVGAIEQFRRRSIEEKDLKQGLKLVEGEIYPVEITKAFKDEPIQYVYVECAFSLVEQTVAENDSIPQKILSTKLNFDKLLVFSKDQMFDWIDYVNKIKNQKDNVFSKDSILNKENSQSDDSVQIYIKKSIIDKNPNSPFNQKFVLPKGFYQKQSNELNPEQRIETNLNTNEVVEHDDIFDFWDEYVPELEEDEYLDIFRMFSKNAINTVMEGTIIPSFFNDSTEFTKLCLIDTLKDLQHKFSNCDFWKFKKETLLELGFMNFANKILLVPIWAYPIIHINGFGRLLAKKDGGFDVLTEDLDKFDFTNCYGCYGFGIPITDLGKIS
jgi:hypothetical protein